MRRLDWILKENSPGQFSWPILLGSRRSRGLQTAVVILPLVLETQRRLDHLLQQPDQFFWRLTLCPQSTGLNPVSFQ